MSKNITEIIEGFKKEFKCINSDCDSSGNIPHQVSEDEWEAEQCQYCFERLFKYKDYIRSQLEALLDGLKITEKKNENKGIVAMMDAGYDTAAKIHNEKIDEAKK